MSTGPSLDGARVRLPGLLVYLERAVAAAGPLSRNVVPRAHGVAPSALRAGEVLAAVAETEVVWLGFQAADRLRPVVVRVRVEGSDPVDAVTGGPWNPVLVRAPRNHLIVPPDSRLVGVPHDDVVAPFRAATLLTVLVTNPPGSATINLVPPRQFEKLTGRTPPPIDPDSAYGGWRAP